MKISIVDLMDYYIDDSVNCCFADCTVNQSQETDLTEGKSQLNQHGKHYPSIRPLLIITTTILLALMVGAVLCLRFAEMSPQEESVAMTTGNSCTEEAKDNVLEEYSLWTNIRVLSSMNYPIELEIPARFAEEIVVDIPFSVAEYNLYYNNTVFIFCDNSSSVYNLPGLVWCIAVTPKEEARLYYKKEENTIYMYNQTILGTDEKYVYELIHPDTRGQYNLNDANNTQSYYEHVKAGQYIIEQFIRHNAIDSDGTWSERYEYFTISTMEKDMSVSTQE